jgi:hypothetical protein
MRTRSSAAVLATLLVTAGPAAADTSDIFKSDNAISLDAGGSYLDYKETQGSRSAHNMRTLDSETGWLPSFALGASFLSGDKVSSPLLQNIYGHIEGRVSVGSTDYSGGLCDRFGNCTPYSNTTDDAIYSFLGQVGRAFPISGKAVLIPFIELGYRHWDRSAQGPYGYSETYTNGDAMGGLLAQFSPEHHWVISLSGAAGTTFSANEQTSGVYFAANYPLGNATIYRLQGKVGYLVADRLELTSTIEYQGFNYKASPVNAYGYYEPDSSTAETTLSVGISYHFF